MAHIGILCMAASGHLNPMLALGCELKDRGHQLSMIGFADAEQHVVDAGIAFIQIGAEAFPLGRCRQNLATIGSLKGLAALNTTVRHFTETVQVELAEIPAVLRAIHVELLIVDQACFSGGTVAHELGIPFVSVSCALLINWEPGVPPVHTGWSYNPSLFGIWRNKISKRLFDVISKPVTQTIVSYREQKGLWRLRTGADAWSPLLQLCQQPRSFEYPRIDLPEWLHFTGPLINATARKEISFDWNAIGDKPIIYASLGTIQNQNLDIYKTIAEACDAVDAQLVISLGGGCEAQQLDSISQIATVVNMAPQLELLKFSGLAVTHAGLNTVLEALSMGVPMVCLPFSHDQPGVAARVAWTGTGVTASYKHLDVKTLRSLINRVWNDNKYSISAKKVQQEIATLGGVKFAASLIEQVIATGRPVLAGKDGASHSSDMLSSTPLSTIPTPPT